MEVKKKFEKPQMEVLKLKPAGMVCGSCGSVCSYEECGSDCPLDCTTEGSCVFN